MMKEDVDDGMLWLWVEVEGCGWMLGYGAQRGPEYLGLGLISTRGHGN